MSDVDSVCAPGLVHWRNLGAAVLLASLVAACGGDDGGTGPTRGGAVAGTVTNSSSGAPVLGAVITIGRKQTTTGLDGRFKLTGLPAGAVTLQCSAAGFAAYTASVTVAPGETPHDIGLRFGGVLEFGNFALYLAPGVSTARGTFIVLGGPRTRGFVTGEPMGAPTPAVEAEIQALGTAVRGLAFGSGIAVLGTSQQAMADNATSDQVLLNALRTAAARTGHPELAAAPIYLLAISSGGLEAAGFSQRNADRVLGLLLKVPDPAPTTSLAIPAMHTVPTYLMLAGNDATVDTDALSAAHGAGRGGGAPWTLAIEPGVGHFGFTDEARSVALGWIQAILNLRLPGAQSGPIPTVVEAAGWLGDLSTTSVAAWANYAGDRSSATWLPSQPTALQWQALMTP